VSIFRSNRILVESAGVFIAVLGFLFMLVPTAPFTGELGVCESGAVRDVLSGNFILPHFTPGPMVHVPPLYWWTAALCVRAFGWTEFALRLPALIAAALTCAVIYEWTGATIGRRAGLWAVAALCLCHFFLDAARQPRMDSMLMLFVTAAAVSLQRAVSIEKSGADSPLPRLAWLAIAAAAIGLGALSKGALGIVLPGAAVALYLVATSRWRELFGLRLITTFAIGLGIGLSWYVAAYQEGGQKFLQWQIGMNLWSRFVPARAGGAAYCVHPFWYFAPKIASGFMPWSFYLPAVAVAYWRRPASRLRDPILYAFWWFAAIFLFFSASHGKCLVYILPAFPPLAVLIGWIIDTVAESRADNPILARFFDVGSAATLIGAIIVAALALAAGFFGAAPGLMSHLHSTDRRFLDLFTAMAAYRSIFLGMFAAAWVLGLIAITSGLSRGSAARQALGIAVVAVAGAWFWFGVMNPALAVRETLEPFAHEVMKAVPEDASIGHIGVEDCDLYFYSPRPIEPVFDFRCGTPGVPSYIVMRKERYEAMRPAERVCLQPMLQSASVDSHGPRLLMKQTRTMR